MPPKTKKRPQRFRCDELEGERFYAANDDVFRYNWWEVFCFPYILCSRLWECCVSLCAGTNQCLVFWMGLQWIICKITKMTTPDPVIFPYFFYVFCQVILLTATFILIWIWIGNSVIIPYFKAYYYALTNTHPEVEHNVTALAFRRYCFRKSEIFDVPYDKGNVIENSDQLKIVCLLIDIYAYLELH